ncbi:MAG: Ig domain-containing protein, partial [Acidobacteriota bacterium]|nr:Ig domain-containing protein [Acidobacteriota bacterium]
GYTLQQQDTATSRGATETIAVNTVASYSGTMSLSSSTNWSAVFATFASATVANSLPVVATNALPNGTQNTFYNATLAATGGASPYTWSVISGSLPSGLMLASGTGSISGTPGAIGTSNFTVQVTDANSQTAAKALGLTINPGATSGISLVQSNAGQGSGVGSLTVAFPAGNTAGNLIVAFIRMSSAAQSVAVIDSAGNSYTDAVSQVQDADGHQVHIFYARNIAGGANSVTATFSATNNHPWLAIYEYSGLNAINPLDQTARAQGSGATPGSGFAAATGSPNELLFAGAGFPSSFTGNIAAGSGYILRQVDSGTSPAASEAAVVNAAGTYAGTFGLNVSTNWSAVLATFKP